MTIARRNLGIAPNKAKPIHISQLTTPLGIRPDELMPIGAYRAKILPSLLQRLSEKPHGKLVLVSSVNTVGSGEGKTCVTIGLTQALAALKKRAIACIPEPSIGPTLSSKGGGTGHGHTQILTSNEINAGFLTDTLSVEVANNFIAAAIDNHIYHGNRLNFTSVDWQRCSSINDRMLRQVTLSCLEKQRPKRVDAFRPTATSELTTILTLSSTYADLKKRIANITLGFNENGEAITLKQLRLQNTIVALIKEAALPNFIQTLEGQPCLMHMGSYASSSIGSPSLTAIMSALKLAHYAVCETGYSTDLGLQKFFEIICRKNGIKPSSVVLVVKTSSFVAQPHSDALYVEINRHIANVRLYGFDPIICLNIDEATPSSILNEITQKLAEENIQFVPFSAVQDGTKGAMELAQKVIDSTLKQTEMLNFGIAKKSFRERIEFAIKNFGVATEIEYDTEFDSTDETITELGLTAYPLNICRNAKTNHKNNSNKVLKIKKLHVSSGAQLIDVVCENSVYIQGMPEEPLYEKFQLSEVLEAQW